MPTTPKPSDRTGHWAAIGEEEVVLTRYLRQTLDSLNPGLPDEAIDNAVRAIVQVSAAQSTLAEQTRRSTISCATG